MHLKCGGCKLEWAAANMEKRQSGGWARGICQPTGEATRAGSGGMAAEEAAAPENAGATPSTCSGQQRVQLHRQAAEAHARVALRNPPPASHFGPLPYGTVAHRSQAPWNKTRICI